MSRLVLSNDEMIRGKLIDMYLSAGFEMNHGDNDVTTFYKLKIKNDNYYSDNGDYVATSGTFFYKGEMGESALDGFLEDARRIGVKNIRDLRKDTLGMFTVAVRVGNTTALMCDESGLYKMFYYSDEEKYVITNSVYHIGKTIGARIDVDGFLKYMGFVGFYDEQTFVEDVKLLLPEDLLLITNGILSVEKDNAALKKELLIYDNTIFEDSFEDALRKVSEIRSKYLKKGILFLTGGVDSRLEYSVHLANDDKLQTGYWKGKNFITNGRDEDLKISKQLSKSFGADFKFYDVSTDFMEDVSIVTEEDLNKYGEMAYYYGNNGKWREIFDEMDDEINFVNFGALAESIRDYYHFVDNYNDTYSFKQFINDEICLYGALQNIFIDDKDRIFKLIEDTYWDRYSTNKMSKEKLSYDDCAYLASVNWRLREDKVYNFANLYCYCFPVLGTKKMYEIIEHESVEEKKGSRLSLEMTRRFKSELLDCPYFSAHNVVNYNKITREIEFPQKVSLRSRIGKALNAYGFTKIIYDLMIYIVYPHTRLNKSIVDFCDIKLRELSVVKDNNIRIHRGRIYGPFDANIYTQCTLLLTIIDRMQNEKN